MKNAFLSAGGRDWDTHRQEFCDHVLATIELYAPGFTASVVGKPDILTPPDLERVFGLTGTLQEQSFPFVRDRVVSHR